MLKPSLDGDRLSMRRLLILSALLILAACATRPIKPAVQTATPPPPPPPPPGRVLLDWRAVIRPAELGRLDRLPEAWNHAISEARASGQGEAVRAFGLLTNADAGQPTGAPPVGDYRCRTVKLGNKVQGRPGLVAYDWFKCRIEATPKGLRFSKVNGSQRPSGLLFPDSPRRMVLLGSISVGNESPANSYGLNPDRDLVGVLEHLPDGRWRLALPWPYVESNLDLIELQPVR